MLTDKKLTSDILRFRHGKFDTCQIALHFKPSSFPLEEVVQFLEKNSIEKWSYTNWNNGTATWRYSLWLENQNDATKFLLWYRLSGYGEPTECF